MSVQDLVTCPLYDFLSSDSILRKKIVDSIKVPLAILDRISVKNLISEAVTDNAITEKHDTNAGPSKTVPEQEIIHSEALTVEPFDTSNPVGDPDLTNQYSMPDHISEKKSLATEVTDTVFTPVSDISRDNTHGAVSKIASDRRDNQTLKHRTYNQAVTDISDRVKEEESGKIKVEILTMFHDWTLEIKKSTGNYPTLPDEELWKADNFKFSEWIKSAKTTPIDSASIKPGITQMYIAISYNI